MGACASICLNPSKVNSEVSVIEDQKGIKKIKRKKTKFPKKEVFDDEDNEEESNNQVKKEQNNKKDEN